MEVVKLLHIGEETTQTKTQELLDFKLTKQKQNFNFDEPL